MINCITAKSPISTAEVQVWLEGIFTTKLSAYWHPNTVTVNIIYVQVFQDLQSAERSPQLFAVYFGSFWGTFYDLTSANTVQIN